MKSEKRLIDAYKLEKVVDEHRGTYSHRDDIIAAIAKMPTVDAVEVVRCKDCKHSSCNPVKLTYACNHPLGLRGFLNEGFYFCSHGERRNEDEKKCL